MRHINVLGINISDINLESAWQYLSDAISRDERGYVCVQGVHGISEAQSNPELKSALNNALLITPDGMPMVWMGKLAGSKNIDRVYGPDLMLKICDEGRKSGMRHFFYGGNVGVADLLKERMIEKFPGLNVVGTYTPPFRPLNKEETKELTAAVKESRPHVVWVGISTPKQELFMAEHLDLLETNLMVGVGAAFDFHAGLVTQAPLWMQNSGLEWIYRLGQEPQRLWRRYLTNNPLFVLRILGQLTGLTRYPDPSPPPSPLHAKMS